MNSKDRNNIELVKINFGFNHPKCIKNCDAYYPDSLLKSKYIVIGNIQADQVINASLDLGRYSSYEHYLQACKSQYKGAVIRQAKKSDKMGFVCKRFNHRLFIPDIVEINYSKEIRSGGPMKPAYRRSVEEMGGYPTSYLEFGWPDCPIHYHIFWGIFQPQQGRLLGDVQVDEKLLGYINFRRIGNMAMYSQILGHGDYLNYGIMYKLHFSILEWIFSQENEYTNGIEHILYAAWNSGGQNSGLQQWKKKTLFDPAYWMTDDIKIYLQDIKLNIKNIQSKIDKAHNYVHQINKSLKEIQITQEDCISIKAVNFNSVIGIIKNNDYTNYIDDILKTIKLKNILLKDVKKNPSTFFVIRHDVDHSLSNGLCMAKIEHQFCYRSTYFLLTPGSYNNSENYYGSIIDKKIVHQPDLIDQCKFLLDLGHEIGIHNDFVSLSLLLKEKPEILLGRELEFFSKHGIEIKGTASHGSHYARKLNFTNYEIFSDCSRSDSEYGRTIVFNDYSVQLNTIKMSEYNLEYEAYFLPKDTYISDTGGLWSIYSNSQVLFKQERNNLAGKEEFSSSLSQISSLGKQIQILIHPCWWSAVVNSHLKKLI